MRIAKNELLAGIPVLKIRDYFGTVANIRGLFL